jgi:hypothetical protein
MELGREVADIFEKYSEATEALSVVHFDRLMDEDSTRWFSPFIPLTTTRIAKVLEVVRVCREDVIGNFWSSALSLFSES